MAYKSTVRRLKRVFTILLICLSAYRDGFSQNKEAESSVTMSAKRTTLGEVFDQVLKQTGRTVWFTDDMGKRIIKDVSFKNTPLQEAMNKIMPKDLEWIFRGRDIQIKKKGISESGVVNPNNNPPSNSSISENTTDDLVDVTGKVTDENGDPIPGATILVKGTQNGAITNGSGFFLITKAKNTSVLVVSSVSFTSVEVNVKGRKSIGIINLSRITRPLEDVIVLAYRTTTNEKLTGNVSKVTSKDIKNSLGTNPLISLAGRVPGVTISQASGFSGSGVEINIQGVNSLLNGIAPFYVVDGVPYAQTLLPNMADVLGNSGRNTGGAPVNGNPLSYINPQDIESIEILKDADATAIYGSRAANGAIIITTKKGKVGALKIDMNFQTGVGTVANRMNLLNTQQYLEMRKEALHNDGVLPSTSDFDLNGSWDTVKTQDWQKKLLGGKAKYTDVQVGASGGNETYQYLLGANYHKESTVFPTDLADERVSIRFNIGATSSNKKLRLDFTGSYLVDNNQLPTEDLTSRAMNLPPNMPDLLTANGDLNWAPNSSGESTITANPLAILKSKYQNKTSNLIGSLNVVYEVFKGIQFKSTFGYNKISTDEIVGVPIAALMPEARPFRSPSSSFGFNDISSWIFEPQLIINKALGRGRLLFISGLTLQESNSARKRIEASGFANDLVIEDIGAAGRLSVFPGSTIQSKYKYGAAFAQLNYDLKDRYIFNISARRDGSSRFGAENMFNTFGAIGGAWIFTKEKFLSPILGFLDYGKIKLSYGTTGNDQIGDYSFLGLYQNINNDVQYRGVSSLSISRLANPALQWEETRKLSMGLDLGFWGDRILVSAVLYKNRSSNMIVGAVIPSTAGSSAALTENLPGVIENRGYEFSTTSTIFRSKDFSWRISANLTIPKNTIKSFGQEGSSFAKTLRIGQPVSAVRTYHSNGVNPENGRYWFLDKDGKPTDNPPADLGNFAVFINPNQRFYGGVSNSFEFKGFSFDFLFQFVKQLGQNGVSGNYPGTMNNQFTSVLDRWQKKGDVKSIQKYTLSDFPTLFGYFNQLTSDAFWEDASFVRLKNANISYNFRNRILNHVGMSALRLYISGQNLLTITPYNGLDPETKSNFSLPPLRVFTVGVQATF